MEKFFIVSLAFIGAFTNVQSLQCYKCYDCPASSLKEEHLETCGSPPSTTTANPGSSSSANPSSSSSATPGSSTTNPGSSTSPGSSTENPSSSSSATPGSSTTNPGSSTSPGSSTENPSSSSSATPGSSTTNPDSSTSPGSSSSANPGSSTENPGSSSSSNPGSSSSVNAGSSSTASENPVSSASALPVSAPVEPDGDDVAYVPQARRVKRHLQPTIVELDSGCTCDGETCICDEQTEFKRAVQYADATNVTYVCIKGTIKVNGTDVIVRDCALPEINGKKICDVAATSNVTDCNTCSTDKCNSGFALQQSIGLLLLALTLAVTK